MRHIKNKFGDVIFSIRDDGTITDKFDCDVIGHLKDDRITDKFDIDTLYRIRPDGTITDEYDCDIIGYISDDGTITDKFDCDVIGYSKDDEFTDKFDIDTLDKTQPDVNITDEHNRKISDDKTITDKDDIDSHVKVDIPNSSTGSSDTSFLGTIFSLISLLVMGIIKIIFYFYKFMFLYYVFPLYSSITVYGFALLILFGIILGVEFLMLPLAIFEMLCFFTSIPYWVILFTQKHKRKMKWKETFKYYGKWFIKGPWAYKDIIELKNKPRSN